MYVCAHNNECSYEYLCLYYFSQKKMKWDLFFVCRSIGCALVMKETICFTVCYGNSLDLHGSMQVCN
jgi:hypothetical protein